MCVEAMLKSAIRHRQVLVHRTRHKADRLVTGALKLLLLAICMCLSPQSVCENCQCTCTVGYGLVNHVKQWGNLPNVHTRHAHSVCSCQKKL